MNMIQALNSALDVKMARGPQRPELRRGRRLFRRRLPRHRPAAEEARPDPLLRRPDLANAASSPPPSAWAPTACARSSRSSSPTTSIPAYDQIVSEAAKLRYRSGGQFTAPITVRTPYGGGIFGGQTHSQSPESLFTHIAGLKIVIPSNPYDAKGLLIAAIEDDDPVIFFEPKRIYNGPFDGWHQTGRSRPGRPRTWPQVPDGNYVDAARQGARSCARAPTSPCSAYGTMVWVSLAGAPNTPASTPRSSTCAPSCRSTSRPSRPR